MLYALSQTSHSDDRFTDNFSITTVGAEMHFSKSITHYFSTFFFRHGPTFHTLWLRPFHFASDCQTLVGSRKARKALYIAELFIHSTQSNNVPLVKRTQFRRVFL